MALTTTEIDLLNAIQTKLMRGDIKRIAENLGHTPDYVGAVLSPSSVKYNERIVSEAARIIAERAQSTNNMLKKVIAA